MVLINKFFKIMGQFGFDSMMNGNVSKS